MSIRTETFFLNPGGTPGAATAIADSEQKYLFQRVVAAAQGSVVFVSTNPSDLEIPGATYAIGVPGRMFVFFQTTEFLLHPGQTLYAVGTTVGAVAPTRLTVAVSESYFD